jgi:hypothetical protein
LNSVIAILVLLLFSPILLPVLLVYVCISALLYLAIWIAWLPQGKDVLLVYSNSPIWHDYLTEQILPLVGHRAVVLNWTERKQWARWRLAPLVFWWFAGRREFNPFVAIFPPFRRAKVFRFWRPFKDWKHGKNEALERMRKELLESLGHKGVSNGP